MWRLSMPSVAKIVKLQVRPSLWANLCFEVGGIVAESTVTLGQQVTQFDFSSLYGQLGVATEIVLEKGVVLGGFPGHHGATGTGASIEIPVPQPANLFDSSDIYGVVSSDR